MRSIYVCLTFTGICLAACSPHASRIEASSDVVFVPLSEDPKSDRRAERVVNGMSRQQVEAIMGPSVETCWIYREGDVRRLVCFRDRKVSAIIWTEELPGSDRALIDATFAGEASNSITVAPDKVAIGASSEQVRRLLGSPQTIREQYNAGTGYRAKFENDQLTEFERIPVPPSIGISADSRNARP